eukprot:gnl/TRDRNA2_/TRDRNA2_56895_c0_seq1.p1 gnl/TRDRNA2_/TRDRNA2_56895_c0~~gnl/TRDRNA2_/TRDRNA2_56895_c0_seq1.p1  ORF type:complete len:441 (-),score=92.63 gnl/TRDRNA2_/TRDRNA2_56895_c0_seq1:89-1366(-)
MATVMPSLGVPVTQVPLFAKDKEELRTVVEAQAKEIACLKARLMDGQRECATLRARLRDANDELSVTTHATMCATQRLEVHADRQGLLLAAGVERGSTERAALEEELQRQERLLCTRDREIAKLRKAAQEREAARFHCDLQLMGLAASHQTANAEVRALGEGIAELRQGLDVSATGAIVSMRREPLVQAAVSKQEEGLQIVAEKQDERLRLSHIAEVTAAKARGLELEVMDAKERNRAFEHRLRHQQQKLESHDHRLVHEASALRKQGHDLRRTLHQEQRRAVAADQRAVLHEQCGVEATGVWREAVAMLGTVKGLVATLRSRGRSVYSPEAPNDPIDMLLHTYLRRCGAGHEPGPPIALRLGHGQYLIGEDRVVLFERNGVLWVQEAGGGGDAGGSARFGEAMPIRNFVINQAKRAMAVQPVNV